MVHLYKPLTRIINKSLISGHFPNNWKSAKVVPLHKKNSPKLLDNYRPVSLLPVSGMILERIVAQQIEHHFESNGLLGSFQYGFRKGKSTISELLTLFDTLLEAKENRKEILLILYDLSAAFDCISHETLVAKMEIYGFNEHALEWLKSYLKSRKQHGRFELVDSRFWAKQFCR